MTRYLRWLSVDRVLLLTCALACAPGCARPTPSAAAARAQNPVDEAPPAALALPAAPSPSEKAYAVKTDLVTAASAKPGDALVPQPGAPTLAVPKGGEAWAAEFAKTPAVGELGGPRAGLTDQELIDFVRGRVAFRDGPGEAGGLGPIYVQKACAECHARPFVGGEGDMDHRLMVGLMPGSVEVQFVHEKAIAGFEPDPVPKGMITAKSRAPMLAGVGLIDKIPPELIASHADPEDKDHDGIHGQVNMRDGVVARWGLKSQDMTLHRMVVGSLVEDLGLTLDDKKDADKAADPEANQETVHIYEAFLGNLASPKRGRVSDVERAGEHEFVVAGCAACHIADMADAKGIYSDLLIHDMGKDDDNQMPDVKATGHDWRTAPLWGLRLRKAFFHDHRAVDLDAAIAQHGGESDKSRLAAQALPPDRRKQLMAFLASL